MNTNKVDLSIHNYILEVGVADFIHTQDMTLKLKSFCILLDI